MDEYEKKEAKEIGSCLGYVFLAGILVFLTFQLMSESSTISFGDDPFIFFVALVLAPLSVFLRILNWLRRQQENHDE